MGWILSMIFLFVGCLKGSADLLVVSAIFAVAGSIGNLAYNNGD